MKSVFHYFRFVQILILFGATSCGESIPEIALPKADQIPTRCDLHDTRSSLHLVATDPGQLKRIRAQLDFLAKLSNSGAGRHAGMPEMRVILNSNETTMYVLDYYEDQKGIIINNQL